MDISGSFCFQPVGQGCFYTGQIWSQSASFHFVYDCGTYSKTSFVAGCIDSFREGLGTAALDMLVISHFDADHVNGVFQLLQSIHCRRVIIPYYDPVQRLLLLAVNSNTDDEDYVAFLTDPLAFLSDPERFRIDEIIIVGGPGLEGQGSQEGGAGPVGSEDNQKEGSEETTDGRFSFYAHTVPIDSDPVRMEILKLERPLQFAQKVKLLLQPYRVHIEVWEFVFYVLYHDNYLLMQDFTESVNDLLRIRGCAIQDLFDEEGIRELNGLYKKHYKNLNANSLVMYHGPLKPVRRHFTYFHGYDEFGPVEWHYAGRFGTMLTGDSNLRSKKNVLAFEAYYANYLEKVALFQIPHHGSKENWDCKKVNGLGNFPTYVINHGLGRVHHPGIEVVTHFAERCAGKVLLNNELTTVAYGCGICFE